MYGTLLPLLLILAGFYFWHNALRARGSTRRSRRALCARSACSCSTRPWLCVACACANPGQGLALLRCYGFDLSTDGNDRRHGSLDMIDGDVVSYDLPVPAATQTPVSGNVIELRPTQSVH